MSISLRPTKGSLLSDSTILLSTTLVANALNYFFHIYIGRTLGPADYGIFVAVISLSYILTVPANTIQTTITKFVSELKTNSQEDQIGSLLIGTIKQLSAYGFLGMVILIIISKEISIFLKIPSNTPIIILGFILITGFVLPVMRGALLGTQRFWIFGTTGAGGILFRLTFGILLISIGFGINGVLFAFVLSDIFVLLLCLFFTRTFFQRKASNKWDGEIYSYSAPVLIGIFLLAAIYNIDLILVKHFFDPIEAGYYAAASLFGKVIYFLGSPISLAIFPKASEKHILKKKFKRLLLEGLFYTLGLSLIGVLAYFLKPSFLVSSVFGLKFLNAAPLIGLFGIAMMFYSLSNVIIIFDMAIRKMRFIFILASGLIFEIAMIGLFHNNITTIVQILVLTMTSIFFSMMLINRKEIFG